MIDLVRETMQSYNEYITALPLGCQEIADFLREDKIGEATKRILQFSEGMGWIIDANHLIAVNGIENLLEPEKIHEFLQEVNNGLEIQDFIIIADMFEYEIRPYFEECSLYEISELQ